MTDCFATSCWNPSFYSCIEQHPASVQWGSNQNHRTTLFCIRRLSIRNLPEWSYCLAKNMPKCGILLKKRCVRLFLPSSLKQLHKNWTCLKQARRRFCSLKIKMLSKALKSSSILCGQLPDLGGIRQMPWFNMPWDDYWRLLVSAPICNTTIRCLMRPFQRMEPAGKLVVACANGDWRYRGFSRWKAFQPIEGRLKVFGA